MAMGIDGHESGAAMDSGIVSGLGARCSGFQQAGPLSE